MWASASVWASVGSVSGVGVGVGVGVGPDPVAYALRHMLAVLFHPVRSFQVEPPPLV